MFQKYFFAGMLAITGCVVQAQYLDDASGKRLKKDLQYLASDELAGRQPGTGGEVEAAEYIAAAFKKAGLKPITTKGYLQPFTFASGADYTAENYLKFTGGCTADSLRFMEDYYTVASSANGNVKGVLVDVGFGIEAPEYGRMDYLLGADYAGMIFVINTGLPEGWTKDDSSAKYTSISARIATAVARGASAIIFTVPPGSHNYPDFELSAKLKPYEIPLICMLTPNACLKDGNEVMLSTGIQTVESTGHNVAGYIDNGAATTVFIGAHFDHLGHGGENSLYRGEPDIHNGADDNASGTALLMELARYIKKNGPKNNNYVFVGFSAEESGLIGSKYFVGSELFQAFQPNYMMNMDMVGRLDSTDVTLIINGAGTSPVWNTLVEKFNGKYFVIKTNESGIGPSDQTSFYLKDIPAIHFFSGTHPDYHKPSDDEERINYGGMLAIGNLMIDMIQAADTLGRLEFTKTKDNTGTTSNFKVTMGVIPDYAWSEAGMRIDGVTEGKPGSNAGLKAGDIVMKVGSVDVKDIYAYMEALGKYAKGDEVEVIYIRDGVQYTTRVKF